MNEYDALIYATEMANLSPCQSKRGVVIFHREHGIISVGYNKPPFPFLCNGSDECKKDCSKTALHAEQIALIEMKDCHSDINVTECEMLHVKTVDGQAVHSLQPSCWQCSKLILHAELKAMWLYQKEGLVSYSAEDFHKQTLINCDLKTNYE